MTKNKGRKWCGELSGENNPKAKLTWKDVELIRDDNFNVKDFIRNYSNMNRSQFYYIKNFKSWISA